MNTSTCRPIHFRARKLSLAFLPRTLLCLAAAALTLPAAWAAPAQQAYIKASNTGSNDAFGGRVAISGNTMVVGAYWEDSNATGVNGNQSNNNTPDSGAVYVFVRSGTNWAQQAYLKASNAGIQDFFGTSVAVSGDTIVVGANYESSNAIGVNGNQSDNSALHSGAAYVFVRNGTNWSQQAYLKASNTGGPSPGEYDGDHFGFSVAISGDIIVVGAPYEDSNATGVNGNQSNNSATNSGAAYVFVRSGTNWSQQAYLKASNAEGAFPICCPNSPLFGWAVTVSGDTVAVGARGERSNATGVNGNQSDRSLWLAGAAYVFVRNGTNWSQQAYLKASNTGRSDQFGFSVAISGHTIVVGAPGEGSNAAGVNGNQSDNSLNGAGAAYIFVRNGTNWSQQAYLKASNPGSALAGFGGDAFGSSVAISRGTVVVGAPGEDSNATGVNGDEGDNISSTDSGAAYVFVRNGTNWSQQAYLKASNTGGSAPGIHDSDSFGVSAAISGDTVVAGAPGEDSNATGVNGNQSDNSASISGAAYVFIGLGIGPSLTLAPDGSGGYFIRFTGAPDVTYRLQRASSVTGPWDTIATSTAPASGLIEYHDSSPLPGQGFYRTVQP